MRWLNRGCRDVCGTARIVMPSMDDPHMSLQLYNSLTRRVEAFEPRDPASGPTMYVC